MTQNWEENLMMEKAKFFREIYMVQMDTDHNYLLTNRPHYYI